MKTSDREKLLDNIYKSISKYANQVNLKTYDPSIYEWRRVDDIKKKLDTILNKINEED